MEIATPTEDCLVLIHELLEPIIKARDENSLNRQEVAWQSMISDNMSIAFQVLYRIRIVIFKNQNRSVFLI